MLDLAGKKVLVIGLGVSGKSAAAFCAARGAQVLACDERADVCVSGLPPEVELRRGALPDPAAFDLVVPSPGVPPARYAARARRVWGDVELAFRALPVPVAAVTGTNGKSSTVRLAESMLRAAGLRARAAGNLGEPALSLVGEPLDVALLEVSSFQLETVEAFRPKVGALLNCRADHLDRHGSFAAYRAAKLRLFARQQPEDFAIAGGDDPQLLAEVRRAGRGRLLQFRTGGPVRRGASLDGGALLLQLEDAPLRLSPGDLPLPPGPMLGNVLAALLIAAALGAEPHKALSALADARPLPHRLEEVALRDGVRWVDDSKATNPAAAAAALAAQRGPVIWIAGGRDKGVGFGELRAAQLRGVRALLAIGEAGAELARTLGDRIATETPGCLEAAVSRARALARPGDVVLLSPACASFDQFASFEERGARFRSLAQEAGS